MREIKFRAWSKKEKIMIYFSSDWAIDGEYSNLGFSIERDEKNFFESYKGAEEEAILMQYTGLKDKNGKEIYGSDYIKGNGVGFSTTHSEVYFSVDGAQVEIGDQWIQLSNFKEIEIIGNKYLTK